MIKSKSEPRREASGTCYNEAHHLILIPKGLNMNNGNSLHDPLRSTLQGRGRNYFKHLQCPLDKTALTHHPEEVVCEQGHHYAIQDGVIYLLDENQQSAFAEVAEARAQAL